MCISAQCNMQRERETHTQTYGDVELYTNTYILSYDTRRRISKVDGFQVVYAFLPPAVPRAVHMSERGPVSVRRRTATSKI